MQRIRRQPILFSPTERDPPKIHDLPPQEVAFTYLGYHPSWGPGAVLAWVFATTSTIFNGGTGVFVALPVTPGAWLLKYGTEETEISKKKVDRLKAKVILVYFI